VGAELITAAAWQDPHYSPFYNWVSHLGLTGPRQVRLRHVPGQARDDAARVAFVADMRLDCLAHRPVLD
jgi:hypothetical protein